MSEFHVVDAAVSRVAKPAVRGLQGLALRGTKLYCPVCDGSFRRFLAMRGRQNARCPRCASAERHRRMLLLLKRDPTLLSRPTRLLHIAPEHGISKFMRRLPNIDYVTGDLLRNDVDQNIDLTAIDLPNQSFDGIICSHVLEHIPDDLAALTEMYRILRPGGWAYLNVPVDPLRTATFEDPAIVSPEARTRAFGQWDHVRYYSAAGFRQRVQEAGWVIDMDSRESITPDEEIRCGLESDSDRDLGLLCSRKR
jgi:SAM-dependent methyltransferase